MPETPPRSQPRVQFAEGCSPVCDVVRRPTRRKKKSRPWHRMLGLIASLPLIWVLITGVLLNHQEDFGFTETEVSSPIVLAAYGMMPEGEPQTAHFGEMRLTKWDGQIFLNAESVETNGDFLGAVATEHGIAIASEQAVTLFNREGEVIEKLDELSLPELPLRGISKHQGHVCLQNAEGWHAADEDWLEFSPVEVAQAQPVEFNELDDEQLKAQLVTRWAGGGLPLSRIILDLHAGHFLGDFAKYFYDFVAVCTLWLIGTGLVIQYRMSRRTKTSC